MANKHQVLKYFDANPAATSGDIAKALDCLPAYVRATLKRNGRKLALSDKFQGSSPDVLRRRAALLIERANAIEATQ